MEMNTELCLDVAVKFDCFPGQRETRTDPGFEASIDIVSVYVGGIDIRASLPEDKIDLLKIDVMARLDELKG